MNRLVGKRVIVTGASTGIGKAIALAYAREGANVVITYLHSASKAQLVVDKIKTFNVKAKAIQFDLLNSNDAKKLVNQSKKFLGGIDVLVNNALCVVDYCDFLTTTEDQLQINVMGNLLGPVRLTQKICKYMIEQNKGGCIINISSTADKVPSNHSKMIAYEISKAGITMFTKSLAIGMAQHGIRVNAIAPGLTRTAIIEKLYKDIMHEENAVWRAILAQCPLGKIGEPSDYQEMVIAITLSDFMTGETVVMDGGSFLGAPTSEGFKKARKFYRTEQFN